MAIHNNYNPNYGSNNAYNIDDDVVGADLIGDEFGEQPNTETAKNLSEFSFIKTFETLDRRGKTLDKVDKQELEEIIQHHTPEK